jgi:hypothetical protein
VIHLVLMLNVDATILSSGSSYTHQQPVASYTFLIAHGSGRNCSITRAGLFSIIKGPWNASAYMHYVVQPIMSIAVTPGHPGIILFNVPATNQHTLLTAASPAVVLA